MNVFPLIFTVVIYRDTLNKLKRLNTIINIYNNKETFIKFKKN